MSDTSKELSGEDLRARREFISNALAAVGISVCGSMLGGILTSCESDIIKSSDVNNDASVEVDIGNEPRLADVGGAAIFTFSELNGGQPMIVVRQSATQFAVYTAVCTHLACTVQDELDNGRILCPCHTSTFNVADGSVTGGPAPAPLRSFPSRYDSASEILTIGKLDDGKDGPTVDVDLDETSGLDVVGAVRLLTLSGVNGGQPLIIIRLSDTELVVYTAVCTHQGCWVEDKLNNGQIYCACHASSYNVETGSVTGGPAPGPLRNFPAKYNQESNILTIRY